MDKLSSIKAVHVSIIEEALQQRKEKNTRYSLRAFAKFLGLHPSALSRILSCKQTLSINASLQIMRKLRLSPDEQEKFIVSVAQDISSHALATLSKASRIEPALLESEERFRSLFDLTDKTVSLSEIVRNEKGKAIDVRFVRVNQCWLDNIGMTLDQVIGKNVSEWLPRSIASLLELYDRVARTQMSEHVEHYLADVDQWYEVVVMPSERDRNIAIGSNVTERCKQEAALKENERLLDAVFQASPVALGVMNASGQMVLSNQRMKDYLPSDIMPSLDQGRGWRWSSTNPDGTRLEFNEFPGKKALHGTATVPGIEMLYVRDDGEEVWTRVAAVPILNEYGGVDGVVTSIEDINEFKRTTHALNESKDRLRTIANIIPDFIWFSEPDGSTVWYNKRWMEYTGQALEQAVGWGWVQTVHPDDRESSARKYREAVEKGQSLEQIHRIWGVHGGYRWFLIRAVPVFDEEGRVKHMYGAAADIHELKSALDKKSMDDKEEI